MTPTPTTEPARAARTCGRCEAEVEAGDLRCPVCALAVPAEGASATERTEVKIVRCGACGASVSWSAEAHAARCAFCGSNVQVELQADPLEQAEWWLPFRVDAASAKAALDAFLRKSAFFRPSDLAKAATLDELKALYFPVWIFNARALVSWTADSNEGSRESDWAPHAGQLEIDFENVAISASRGLTEAEARGLLGHYDRATREPGPAGPANVVIERFDAKRSGARRRIQDALHRAAVERVKPHIPGRIHRKLHVAVMLKGLDTDRYALPAWVLAYRYREQLFRVVVHGQNPQVLLGSAPTSAWKVLLTVAGGALLVAILWWLITA